MFEVIGPADRTDASLFLLNRTGRLRRRITLLEHALDAARAELAQVEADASQAEGARVSTSEVSR